MLGAADPDATRAKDGARRPRRSRVQSRETILGKVHRLNSDVGVTGRDQRYVVGFASAWSPGEEPSPLQLRPHRHIAAVLQARASSRTGPCKVVSISARLEDT